MTDKQLIKYAMAFRRGLLGKHPSTQMCFVVCRPLVSLLNLQGVAVELGEGKYHYWLALSDGRVLDPTIDQFNDLEGYEKMPPVYLGKPIKEIHKRAMK